MNALHPSIEPLEVRIAPAALAGNILSYKDSDGDLVKVKFSGGTGVLTTANFTFDDPNAFTNNVPVQLQMIDLGASTAFNGLNIKFSVTKVPGGDGRANVGFLEGTGVDLGKVIVKGDLGRVNAGDGNTGTTALKTLKLRSMGVEGLATQGGAGNLESDINGAIGSLIIARDLQNEFIALLPSNAADGKIGSVKIGGSILGGAMTGDGSIFVSGDIGKVTVKRDIIGGDGVSSGQISTTSGKIGKVSVGGSVKAGSSGAGGAILSVTGLGKVTIGGDLAGGTESSSGYLRSGLGAIKSVTIGGDVLGSGGSSSGSLYAGLDIGPVMIKGNLQGGDGSGSGSVTAVGNLGSVTIKGDLLGGGAGARTGLFAGIKMGAVKIKGDLRGDATEAVNISAAGAQTVAPGATKNLAIDKLEIGGDVEAARIMAGFDLLGFTVNGHVQIGAVKVGGDWTASTMSAGIFNKGANGMPGGGDDNLNFGDANDEQISAGPAGIISRIASIQIKGDVIGTGANATDHFGMVAEQLGPVKVHGVVITPPTDFSPGTGSDVTVHEV